MGKGRMERWDPMLSFQISPLSLFFFNQESIPSVDVSLGGQRLVF
jgi:hypothetical protein